MYTSRGMDSIAAVLFTGSRLMTIIVSVFLVVDPSSRESMPRRRTLRRSVPVHSGVGASGPEVVPTRGAFASGAKIFDARPAHGADPRYAAAEKATGESDDTPTL